MSAAQAKLRRVVITGMGLVSPLGLTKESLWEALAARTSGIAPISGDLAGLPVPFAARAAGFTGGIDDFGTLAPEQKKAIRKGLKLMCRESQMGVAAAQRALNDARLDESNLSPERSGVVYGSDYMVTDPEDLSEGIQKCLIEGDDFNFSLWGTQGISKMSPLWLLKYLPNMPASHIAIYNDLRGPNNSLTHREAAGNLAIGEAFRVIARGHADIMIAGATGTRIHPTKAIHAALQEELADGDAATASRPFDRDRRGMVLGEGSGAIVLESLESAQARGASIHGEVVATASSNASDGPFIARPDIALINVMRACLREANLSIAELGHIHAHGNSTRSGDQHEANAIVQVFGDRATTLPVTAAKSYFGNLGAGSGVIELIASTLALAHGELFPILNYESPDVDCPVAAVRPGSTAAAGDSFLNLSVTPQGQASAVLIRRV